MELLVCREDPGAVLPVNPLQEYKLYYTLGCHLARRCLRHLGQRTTHDVQSVQKSHFICHSIVARRVVRSDDIRSPSPFVVMDHQSILIPLRGLVVPLLLPSLVCLLYTSPSPRD